MESQATESRKKGLARDQQGAIMVVGLFMAISLIGSLWFMLGIGNAIVIRDKAIEAADHVAFSAATVHARGMNFISALNLILFALTLIFVVLATVANIIKIIAALGGWSYYKMFWVAQGCWPSGSPAALVPGITKVAYKACEFGHKVAEFADKYNDRVLEKVFPAIGTLEDVIQIGMPVAAEAAAVSVASNYKPYVGFALAGTIVPGISKSDHKAKIGLPITKLKNDYLCKRTFIKVESFIKDKVPSPFKEFLSAVTDGLEWKLFQHGSKEENGGLLEAGGIGCLDHSESRGPDNTKGPSGEPWKDSHIHVVADGAGNGTDHLQVWGLIFNAKDENRSRSEQRVSMSKNKGGTEAGPPPKARIYYSQAEYYFDCTSTWDNPLCYDSGEKGERNASFSMNWKARLRRVYAPDFGKQLIGQASEFLLAGGSLSNFLASKVGNNPFAQKLEGTIASLRGGTENMSVSGTELGGGMDSALNFLSGGNSRPIH